MTTSVTRVRELNGMPESDTIITASSLDEPPPVPAAAPIPGHSAPVLLTEAETAAVGGEYIGSYALIAMTSSCMGGALPH